MGLAESERLLLVRAGGLMAVLQFVVLHEDVQIVAQYIPRRVLTVQARSRSRLYRHRSCFVRTSHRSHPSARRTLLLPDTARIIELWIANREQELLLAPIFGLMLGTVSTMVCSAFIDGNAQVLTDTHETIRDIDLVEGGLF